MAANTKPSSFTRHLKDDNFISKLQIPSDFVTKQAENLCWKVFLTTSSGGGGHRIVKLEKIGKGHFFTDGWRAVAQVLDLKNGEFLLFRMVEESKFQVSVYGTNRCVREISWGRENADDTDGDGAQDEDEEDDDDEGDVARVAKTWKLVLTRDHAKQVEIPEELGVETGKSNRMVLHLVSEDGKTRKVFVTAKRGKCYYMTTGWNQFLVEDKVQVGSTILFEFDGDSSNVVKIKILKPEGTGGGLFRRVQRGRGRPPNFDK